MSIKKHSFKFVLLMLIILSHTANLFAKDKNNLQIPNVNLTIAVREKKEPLGKDIHLFTLYCGLGACSLAQLSLNECRVYDDNQTAFTPSYFKWATWLDTLDVKLINSDTLEITVFQGTHRSFPAHIHIVFLPQQPFAEKIIEFQATGFRFTDTSENGEYIPISGPSHLEHLDCPLLVPGYGEPQNQDSEEPKLR